MHEQLDQQKAVTLFMKGECPEFELYFASESCDIKFYGGPKTFKICSIGKLDLFLHPPASVDVALCPAWLVPSSQDDMEVTVQLGSKEDTLKIGKIAVPVDFHFLNPVEEMLRQKDVVLVRSVGAQAPKIEQKNNAVKRNLCNVIDELSGLVQTPEEQQPPPQKKAKKAATSKTDGQEGNIFDHIMSF